MSDLVLRLLRILVCAAGLLVLWPGWIPAQAGAPVPCGDPEGLPERARQIERHGITWHFSEDHVIGAFANGDPWVIGPVTIQRIEPRCAEAGGRVRHGAMIDPDPTRMMQGYDSAVFGEEGGVRSDARLNVAWQLSPDRAIELACGSSLVSVVSREQAEVPPTLQTAAVLTCVAVAPAPDAFRPPYVAGDKAMPYRAADLDFGVLRKLQAVGDAPPIEAVARDFARLWLDHFPEWVVRYTHPLDNMPDYGREIAAKIGTAALLLNLDLPDQSKRELLIRFVQVGLDNHAALRAGCRWQGLGGHGHGRKLPILVAALALHDDRMLRIGVDYDSKTVMEGGRGAWFGEDGQTFYVRETSAGVWNQGHGGYTREQDGLPEWGFSHADNPELDNVVWGANPYRRCCTANAWIGEALAARVMGLQEAWNHPAWFDYCDRYQQVVHTDAWHRAWVPWQAQMWDAYRSNY